MDKNGWFVYKNGQLICETAPDHPPPIWKAKSTASSSSFIDNIVPKVLEIYNLVQNIVIDTLMVKIDFLGLFILDLLLFFIIVPLAAFLFTAIVRNKHLLCIILYLLFVFSLLSLAMWLERQRI